MAKGASSEGIHGPTSLMKLLAHRVPLRSLIRMLVFISLSSIVVGFLFFLDFWPQALEGYESGSCHDGETFPEEAVRLHLNNTSPDNPNPKFFYHHPDDCTGFGNKMRQLSSDFLVALASGRAFVAEYSILEDCFDPPTDDLPYYRKQFPLDIRSRLSMPFLPQYVEYDISAAEAAAPNLSQSMPSEVVVSLSGGGYDSWMFLNPRYGAKMRSLLGFPPEWKYRRKDVIEKTMRYLLCRPSWWFLTHVIRLAKWTGFFPGVLRPVRPAIESEPQIIELSVMVRARVGVYWPGLESFNDCSAQLLKNLTAMKAEQHNTTSENVKLQIYITTDTSSLRDPMREFYSKLGQVVMNPFVEDVETTDATKYRKPWRPHPAMLDWFLLGECDAVIGGFTTYVYYAAARTGRPMQFRNDEQGCRYYPPDDPDWDRTVV